METSQNVFDFWKVKDGSAAPTRRTGVRRATALAPTTATKPPVPKKNLVPPQRPPPPEKTNKNFAASLSSSPSLLHKRLGPAQSAPSTTSSSSTFPQTHNKKTSGHLPVSKSSTNVVGSSSSVSELVKTLSQSVSLHAISPHKDGPRKSSGSAPDRFQPAAKDLVQENPGFMRSHSNTSLGPRPINSHSRSFSSGQSRRTTAQSRRWNSQSESGTVKSTSGFTCYLDGPIDEPPLRDTLSPPLPLSPLHDVSDIARVTEMLKDDHFIPARSRSLEMEEFWSTVEKISKGSGSETGARPYLLAPVLAKPHSSPPMSKLYGTISLSCSKPEDVITVLIYTNTSESPKSFQLNSSTLAHTVIVRAMREIHGVRSATDTVTTRLKVCGREEFLHSNLSLGQHEYVNQCQKLKTDVKLVLADKPSDQRKLGRTQSQDEKPSPGGSCCVSREEVNSLLNSYFAKEHRFRGLLESKSEMASSPISLPALVQNVVSCVCLLSERLQFIEPPDVIDAVYNLRRACKTATQLELQETTPYSPTVLSVVPLPDNDSWISIPDGSYVVQDEHVQDILKALDVLKASVHHLVALYCSAFCPGYSPQWVKESGEYKEVTAHTDQMLRVKVASLHRICMLELIRFTTLQVEVCVYYRGKALSKCGFSPHAKPSRDFFDCVVWDKWLNLGVELGSLPLESRVLFTLYGIEVESDHQQNRVPIAWAAFRLYDSSRVLASGSQLVGLWSGEPDPVDSMYSDLRNRKSMILLIEFEEHPMKLKFPTSLPNRLTTKRPAPPPNVTKTLMSIGERNRFQSHTPTELGMVWSNRMFCSGILDKRPRGLPTVILAAPSSGLSELGDIWAVTKDWPSSEPTHGLELLDSQHPDICVRNKGVDWLTKMNDDDLCDLLPQLVQSLRYDTFQLSAMSKLLLQRVRSSQRVAHYLFWHLRVVSECDLRFKERYSQLLCALEVLTGSKLLMQLNTQVELVGHLRSVATAVKASRFSHRQTTLIHGLQTMAEKLIGPFSLPLNPAMVSKGISVEACSYFNSNTVPLRLSFLNVDPCGEDIEIIYKVGDDLRQDILVLQMIKLMEKIWLRSGLDLRMITYQCVATGTDEGMLELVTESSTLRTIQTERGVTGSFKDKPLSEWLMRHNSTESSYQQAVENFTLSCAGYCVATFVLGICDRHNDNIMIKKSGHMFHIDFGKILGNAQMFGNIKRDRAPFVLTKDMAYVINGGDQPTPNFQRFTDLCCAAYNELRKHSSLLISLLSLMLSSGLPELSTMEDIQYVSDALLPGKSEAEATFTFTKYIEDSLTSLATPVNFFIHNLAQFKFSSSENAPSLFSFCPQAYSIATDGKVTNTVVVGFHKRFHPDTHYIYQIEVYRDSSVTRSVIFRRYREFDELQKKLVQCFPDDTLPNLPGKIFTPGKSNTKETSEARKIKLNEYLCNVLEMEPRVSESDIVYTFLHCLIRDEQELGKLREEEQGLRSSSLGKIKLELAFKVKQQTLTVMVRHVKDLAPREGFETADPYVKVYLLPDLQKTTKQKTKVAKRTLNPTYNQQFVYVIPQSALSNRSLQVSVWDANRIVNKQCLCMDTIKLSDYRTQLLEGTAVSDWFEMSPYIESKTVWH